MLVFLGTSNSIKVIWEHPCSSGGLNKRQKASRMQRVLFYSFFLFLIASCKGRGKNRELCTWFRSEETRKGRNAGWKNKGLGETLTLSPLGLWALLAGGWVLSTFPPSLSGGPSPSQPWPVARNLCRPLEPSLISRFGAVINADLSRVRLNGTSSPIKAVLYTEMGLVEILVLEF